MKSNSKRQTNRLHFVALMRWVVIAIFLGVTGLSYVYLKNQLNDLGSRRRAMEGELRDLIAQNNVLDAQIAGLTSFTALQHRVSEGFVKLVPIGDSSVVRVRTPETTRWVAANNVSGNEFQTVSHEGISRP